MMKTQKGYSMVVLVIAITVILILVSSAVSVLNVSREENEITNFIFDITTVQEQVQEFYISTGTLPVKNFDKIDMNVLNATSDGILSQLYVYDNENYYYVDLSQLGTMSVKDSERKYIVNEGSLKIYVENGTEYGDAENEDTKTTYYTLTSALVEGLEQYVPQEEEMLIIGNPITWVSQANIRLVLPRRTLESAGPDSWASWTFKWDFGPKSVEELAAISESDSIRNFEYGDILNVKSNGIYSIYVKDPEENETVINVNVSKIDDIKPSFKITSEPTGTEFQAIDNETGIKFIKYKTLTNYNNNKLEAEENSAEDLEGRTSVDFYLVDGEGKDLIYDLEAEIKIFKTERTTIQTALDDENSRHLQWVEEHNSPLYTQEEKDAEEAQHQNTVAELNNQLIALYEKYPYLLDIYGKTDASKLVVYIEDYSGNGIVAGINEFISTEILANAYNISLEGL